MLYFLFLIDNIIVYHCVLCFNNFVNILSVRNLTKKFKINQKQQKNNKSNEKYLTALKDFSMDFKEGNIYGILGPNGAGKTTLLRILSSLIQPNSGEIFYNNKKITGDALEYKSKVGFLTSELKLDDFFTPDYTFTYFSKLYGISDEYIIKNKEKLFKEFEIDKYQDTKICNLSTGMKQKVYLAISLCNNPDIIIFDEPTNGLDLIGCKYVEDYLLNLKKQNKIIIVSTHIFSLIEDLCDEIAIILNGSKVLEGNLNELTKNKSLSDLFFELYEKEEKGVKN